MTIALKKSVTTFIEQNLPDILGLDLCLVIQFHDINDLPARVAISVCAVGCTTVTLQS